MEEFDTWLSNAEMKLECCQEPAADQETMEERRTMIQVLTEIFRILASVCKSILILSEILEL